MKYKIISISPTPAEYTRLETTFLKKYVQSMNIDKEELKSKFDIIEGSNIGGCDEMINFIDAVKIIKKGKRVNQFKGAMLNCNDCGEEYYIDDMVDIGKNRSIYHCECGYENLLI